MKARIRLADGQEVEARLVFSHRNPQETWMASALRGGTGALVRGYTIVDVLASDGTMIATSIAFCSASDNYNRETGRRLALKKLLRESRHLPGEARQALWACYQNRKGSV